MVMIFCITLEEFVRVGDCDGGGVSVFTPFDLGLIMPSILSISSCDMVQRVVERKKQNKIRNKKIEKNKRT